MAKYFRITCSDGVYRASGELDADTSGEFWTAVVGEEADEGQPVHVDMSAVPFMDSHALRTLLMLQRRRPVVVVNPSTQVQQLLHLTGLEREFGLS
jgi:anti-anti-sigma factor